MKLCDLEPAVAWLQVSWRFVGSETPLMRTLLLVVCRLSCSFVLTPADGLLFLPSPVSTL